MRTFKTKKGTELPLVNLQGKEYLQVAHRLVFFREEHPDWGIEVEFIHQDAESATAKATIRDTNGRIIAMAHKEESYKDFPRGHREKSETGAIGRALALAGFGTQFEPELDEGERVVDSPIAKPNPIFINQPEEGDGVPDNSYRVSFGKWKGRTIEDIAKNFGFEEMDSYVEYIFKISKKEQKEVGLEAKEFINRYAAFRAAFETSPIK